MRAIAYVRISELTDATTSPERQAKEAARWVEALGGELVDVEQDLDVSGYHRGLERPGLRRAIERIEAREADTLVVWRIDRLARSIVTFHEVLQRVEAVGGRLVSVSESLDFATAAGRMVANVLASFAQFESETISGRVRAAQVHLREIGKWPGGRRPFGWVPVDAPDGKGRVLALRPEEAAILREAARKVLSGEPLSDIAGELNRRGIHTAQGAQWTRLSVRQMLSRPGVYGRDGEEPLLSQEDWIAVQKALGTRKSMERFQVEQKALLGNVQCGACGGKLSMTTWVDRKANKRYLVYKCATASRRPGLPSCGSSVAASRLEEAVIGKIMDLMGHLPAFEPEGEIVDPAEDERRELEAALERLEEDRYVGNLFTGEEGTKRYRGLYGSLVAKLEALPQPTVKPSAIHIPLGLTFQEAWDEADEETRRAWVSSMPFTVVVDKGTPGAWNPERISLRWAQSGAI